MFDLSIQPFDHQITGIKRMCEQSVGFANFCEQGTGKTLMAIGMMNELGIARVVIVCPNSLKLNWKEEIESKSEVKWNIFIPGNTKAKVLEYAQFIRANTHKVMILNYESVDKYRHLVHTFSPMLIIADEAHAIKNHKAKRTKALKKILAPYRLAMTGTPVANNPLDIWSIMDWLRPGYLGSNFYAFRARHCIIYTGAGFPMIKGFINMDELKKKVDRYSYRVLKEECLDLPEKTFTKRVFELSAPEAKAYKQMAEEMVAEIGDGEVAASTMLVKMLRLQQLTSGFIQGAEKIERIGKSKIENLEELLDELQDKRVVIWAKFKEEIANIYGLVSDSGRPCYMLTGNEDLDQRQYAVKCFQEIQDNAIIVGIPSVGGLGITLTAASHCVYYSNSFSYTDRLQSQDRLHRIGQKNNVTYYDLIAARTIDAYILKTLEKKAKMSDKITGDDLKKIIFDLDNT